MPWGAAIGAAATIGSAAIQASSADSAGNTLSQANQAAIPLVQKTQADNVASIQGNETPYTTAGATAAAGLNAGEQAGGQFTTNFSLSDLQQDPGYLFDLQQGNQAVQRAAAASGTLGSGGTLKSIANYTTGLASQEVNNAYTRYTTDQTNQYNRLAGIAGLGQTAVNQVNQAQTNQANTVSNAQYGATVAAGAANAAGTVGAGNAISGGLTSLANNPSTLAGISSLFGAGNGSSFSTSNPAAFAANNAGYGNSAYNMVENSSSF